MSGSAGPEPAAAVPVWSRAGVPTPVTSQTCVLHHLDANRSLCAAAAAAGGEPWSSHSGGAPQTLLNGLYLHATHAIGHLPPCMSFICPATSRHFHHTNFEQLPNTLEFPSERLHHGGVSSKVTGAAPLYSLSSCSVQEVL